MAPKNRYSLSKDERKFGCVVKNCGARFQTRKALNRHTVEVHGRVPCTVPNCGKTFVSQARLNNHLKRHMRNASEPNRQRKTKKKKVNLRRSHSTRNKDSKEPISQDNANTLETSLSIVIINSQELHVCGVCGEMFASAHGLNLHQKNPCPGLTCQICGESFQYRRLLTRHLEVHREERTLYKCVVCAAKYLRNQALKKHQAAEHGVRAGPVIAPLIKHRCNICQRLISGASLFEHVVRCHEKIMTRKGKLDMDQSLVCSICSYDVKPANYAAHVHMDMYLYYMPRNRWVGKILCKTENCEFKARGLSQYRLHLFAHDISFESWKQHKKCDKCNATLIHKKPCPFYKKRQSNKKPIKKWKLLFMQRKEKLAQRPDVYHCGFCNEKVTTRLEMLSHCEKVHGISIRTDEKELIQQEDQTQQGCSVCFICNKRFFCPVATHFHVKHCQQRHGSIKNNDNGVLVENGEKQLRGDEDNADNSSTFIGQPKLALVTTTM